MKILRMGVSMPLSDWNDEEKQHKSGIQGGGHGQITKKKETFA